jgi:hypothetical protein
MKEKAYILDLSLLEEQNLSIDEFIVLVHIDNELVRKNSLDYLNSLEKKQFIKLPVKQDEEILLREKGKLFIDFVSIEKVSSVGNKKIVKRSDRSIKEGLKDFVKEYRSLWKGLKPGSMGSENGCADKLSRWMKENPQYSLEDISKAAKLYIKSVDNLQFLQAADYFIYKKDAHGESSRLSAFIDEIGENIPEDNWTTQLN